MRRSLESLRAASVLHRLQRYARGAAVSIAVKASGCETRDTAVDVLGWNGDGHRACALLKLMLEGEVS